MECCVSAETRSDGVPSYSNLIVKTDQSDAYAACRPNYETDCPLVYERIFRFAGFSDSQQPDLAIDVATGSGQAVSALSRRFKRVIGAGRGRDSLIVSSVMCPSTVCVALRQTRSPFVSL